MLLKKKEKIDTYFQVSSFSLNIIEQQFSKMVVYELF